jgi:hypothetical protein
MLSGLNSLNIDAAPDTRMNRAGAVPHARAEHAARGFKNDRTAGNMPVWREICADSGAEFSQTAQPDPAPDSFKVALAYQTASETTPDTAAKALREERPLGFGDILDVINPLQHIPLVGDIYRHITGDEIRGASKLAGSTLFGGPIGAAAGLIDLVIEEETGRSIGAHAFNFNDTPAMPDRPNATGKKHNPEIQLANATGNPFDYDLPMSLLVFTDTGHSEKIEPDNKNPVTINRMA